jgi:hypothetical protein
MKASVAADSATAYATASGGGRTAVAVEVWLRGNVRPVLVVGATAVAAVALATGVAAATGAGAVVLGACGGATVVVAVIVAALARVAAGPRLGRRGSALVVRLAPWRVDEVPLGVVECLFPGSQPLDGPVLRHVHADDTPAGDQPTRRVGTLVIRFAERAAAWRERPTFAPWGAWHDGHAIVDGRWCEPLSAEVARALGQRLLEAKREAAAAGPSS